MAILPWQQLLWQQLGLYLSQQRVPQALLISGNPGVGKRQLMTQFAAAMLCNARQNDHQSCGHCSSCLLFAAGTHPDYLHVEPDEPGKTIGIDKIRQLIVKLALKPQYDGYRVVVIDPADQLNNASANAFLKCLEEPTERTSIFLISEQPFRLPATIRSRCQKIVCQQPDQSIAVRWLQAQGIAQDADLALRLALGAPMLAKQYAEQDILSLRRDYFASWLSIADDGTLLVEVADQWHKQARVELTVVLAWMASWLADIVKCAGQGGDACLQNPDLKKPLQALALRLELKGIFRLYDSLLQSRSLLNTQLNKQLLVEQLLIEWSQLTSR